MDFLKNHGEKLLFLVLAIGWAASVVGVLNARGAFQPASAMEMREASIVLDTEQVERSLALITTDAPQLEVGMDAFTPEARKACVNPDHAALIPEEDTICPFCGFEQTGIGNDSDGDGIPDQQELSMGLDPNDPTDVYEDHDGDGFITLLEYQLGTDPMEASSHPPLVDFLRLAELDQRSVRFELLGFSQTTEENYTLQLRWAYPGERRWRRGYVNTGERFGRRDEFRAVRFVEKRTQQEDGRWVDESHALIEVGRHTLKLGRYGDDAKGKVTESLATLRLIAGPEWSEQVRVGSAFELDNKTYNVIDISNGTVVVKVEAEDSTITVRQATPGEEDALKGTDAESGTSDQDDDAPNLQNFF